MTYHELAQIAHRMSDEEIRDAINSLGTDQRMAGVVGLMEMLQARLKAEAMNPANVQNHGSAAAIVAQISILEEFSRWFDDALQHQDQNQQGPE